MNRARYLALSAEHALSTGRPLHEELAAAAFAAGKVDRQEESAVARAREGDLASSLRLLGVHPLVAAAAQLRPEAVGAVGRRLLALPSQLRVMLRPWSLLRYFGAILLAQALISVMLSSYVLPMLAQAMAGVGAVASGAALYAGNLMALAPFLLVPGLVVIELFWGRRYGALFPRTSPLWWLAAARACAAASELCAAGARPEEALPPMLATEHLPPAKLAALLVPGALDAPGLAELSRHFLAEAEHRAARLATGVKIGGTILVALMTAAIVGSVYLRLPLLAAGAGS